MFDLQFTSGLRVAMNILPIPDADIPARIVLHHTELAPRNIFIDVQSGAIRVSWIGSWQKVRRWKPRGICLPGFGMGPQAVQIS